MVVNLKKYFPRSIKRMGKRAMRSVVESLSYRFVRRPKDLGNFRKIVFVCKGNVCRSAFAEHYLRSVFWGGDIEIESCGLDVDQGGASPPEAIRIAVDFGLDLSAHRSKGIAECDLKGADLIVAMEYCHYLRLRRQFPKQRDKIRLLLDFAPWPENLVCNLYDPFGMGEKEFTHCFTKMQRALAGLSRCLETSEIDQGTKEFEERDSV